MARSLSEVATYRPACADDMPFLKDAWLNSWRVSRYAGVVRNCDYYEVTRNLIEDLIARGAVVYVAEFRGELLGFACGEVKDGISVHHYTYLKDPFHSRSKGEVEERLLNLMPGTKPGFFTFAQERFLRDRAWRHTPEMARRKTL